MKFGPWNCLHSVSNSRTLGRSLWASSRKAGHPVRMRSIQSQSRPPLSYQEPRLKELSPSSNSSKPKQWILGTILSSVSDNSMSLNCTIIPSGEPKHSSELQKISLSILPALSLFLIDLKNPTTTTTHTILNFQTTEFHQYLVSGSLLTTNPSYLLNVICNKLELHEEENEGMVYRCFRLTIVLLKSLSFSTS